MRVWAKPWTKNELLITLGLRAKLMHDQLPGCPLVIQQFAMENHDFEYIYIYIHTFHRTHLDFSIAMAMPHYHRETAIPQHPLVAWARNQRRTIEPTQQTSLVGDATSELTVDAAGSSTASIAVNLEFASLWYTSSRLQGQVLVTV